jgi:hypothetical protein
MANHIVSKRLGVALIGLACAILIGYFMTQGVSAQQGNPGNPSILAVVNDIQNSLVLVADALSELETKVDNIGATVESNVRASAPIFAAGGTGAVGLACPASNISDETKTIHIELISFGGVIDQENLTLQAGGHAQTVTARGLGSTAYCKFTVLDGTREDIRGAMTVGGGFTVDLVVPAD